MSTEMDVYLHTTCTIENREYDWSSQIQMVAVWVVQDCLSVFKNWPLVTFLSAVSNHDGSTH